MGQSPNIKAVLFDLDGTLIDASEPVSVLVAKTIEEMTGRKVDPKVVLGYIGQPIWKFFEDLAPEMENVNGAVELYRKKYDESANDMTKLLPGVRETFEELKAKGVRIGVVSQRPVYLSRDILQHFKLEKLVDVITSGEETEPKPSPESILAAMEKLGVKPEETVLVGDTVMDMKAARNAGARAIGVLTGTDDRNELAEAGADVVLQNLRSFELI